MPFIQTKCPKCSKIAEVKSEYSFAAQIICILKCGHLLSKDKLVSKKTPEDIISIDGKKLMPYQCDGVRFAQNSTGRCLIGDEMRLGKTVQALGLLAIQPELLPALIIVKSNIKTQWQREAIRWLGEDAFAQVLESSNDVLISNMDAYIISYDLVRRFNPTSKSPAKKRKENKFDLPDFEEIFSEQYQEKHKEKPNKLIEMIKKAKIKTIILDECQQIKNSESTRTIEVRELCKVVDNVIALSGTPIKNHAGEFFPILNILQPDKFPSQAHFERNWCDTYWMGSRQKIGGIRDPESWKKYTQNFIIRRERKDVMPEMPTIWRDFSFSDLGEEVKNQYDIYLHEFIEGSEDKSSNFDRQAHILAYLNKMRYLTGLSKINPCIDFCMEFLGSTDRKLVIFTHHKDVRAILLKKLSSLMKELELELPLTLADVDNENKQKVIDSFLNDNNKRILIASTLADGEGTTMSKEGVTPDFVMMEREWNPANEEQAESRFPNINNKNIKVNGTYLVAVGTVDEFFSEIVERKREVVNKTLNGEAIEWDQSSIMSELSEKLMLSGSSKWKLK